jgi:hypothetical protein
VVHRPLDEYRFNMYMRDLLAEKAKDIFRCKGVLSVHVSRRCTRACCFQIHLRCCGCVCGTHPRAQGYGSTKFVFQGVHETICYGPADQSWRPEEQRLNQVVFIGRGLNRKVRQEGVATTCAALRGRLCRAKFRGMCSEHSCHCSFNLQALIEGFRTCVWVPLPDGW